MTNVDTVQTEKLEELVAAADEDDAAAAEHLGYVPVANGLARRLAGEVLALRKQVALGREALEDIVRGGLRVDVDNVSRAQDALAAMKGESDGEL